MTDGSYLEVFVPLQADASLNPAALEPYENADSSIYAKTNLPSPRDSPMINQGNTDAIPRDEEADAVAAHSEVEAQPPRERPNKQRRRQRRDSADTQSTAHSETAPPQDVHAAAAKHMAGLALQRLSHGGGESTTASRDPHLYATTVTTGSSSPGEDHQRHARHGHVRHRSRTTHSGKRHSSPGSNTTPGITSTTTATGSPAFQDPILDPVASEDLVAAASAAALAAALGSARLASIAAARPPPPPEEVKIHPPRPNFMRSMTAPRTDGGGYYSLTVSYDSPPMASPSASGYMIRRPAKSPVPKPRYASTAPPPAVTATTAPLMARTTSMSPTKTTRPISPTAAAGRRRGGGSSGGGGGRGSGGRGSGLSAFTDASVAGAAIGSNSGGADAAASTTSPVDDDLMVNHCKLLVDRELLAVEVRRLASQVQHLTAQQGLLQEELQRLLNRNSNLNSALASTVTTVESQAELMDILSEAVRNTVLVDEHDAATAASEIAAGS
ncbi:hypothetical protein Vafri_16639, partial [Volvox africanus]